MKETLQSLAYDAPIPATAGLWLAGLPLSEWVLILTAIWAAARVAMIALDFYWKLKDRRNGKSN